MGKAKVPVGAARVLIDELIAARRVLAAAQARAAELMVSFADTRTAVDRQTINGLRHEGVDARFKAGEFAANEISMACSTSKFTAQRLLAMTRRVRAEAPAAWVAWQAGDIDQDKIERINRALRRLQRDSSKAALNTWVVDVAVCKSPEILGRCLNQFILENERDLQDERLTRSFEDRFVSVRPDLDGMSFVTAELSAVDATAIDQVLFALAGIAEPGDTRTVQQRRADAMVDVMLGRVTNGCHVQWDTNTDTDDHLDDHLENTTDQVPAGESAQDKDSAHDDPDDADDAEDPGGAGDCGGAGNPGGDPGELTAADGATESTGDCTGQAWDAEDWDQPASTFRPDHRNTNTWRPLDEEPDVDWATEPEPEPDTGPPGTTLATATRSGTYPTGRTRITPCPGGGQARPIPVTIGIVITAQSLFGHTNTPGQLMDRSAAVGADQIRQLAHHKGTLFYRLITDNTGNLLDVTELGRFPSRKLGLAVKFRDGTCTAPTCTTPATRTDIDHLIPVPEGPTTSDNLDNKCRHDHRAKTHAGHQSVRTGPHTTEWTTPTGHTYQTTDMPFPTEKWPDGS